MWSRQGYADTSRAALVRELMVMGKCGPGTFPYSLQFDGVATSIDSESSCTGGAIGVGVQAQRRGGEGRVKGRERCGW